MDVTKSFATFIVTPMNFYVTQHSLDQLHLIQSVVMSCSDMKEKVVNESATGFFGKKCPFCKESQWEVNQKHQPLISCTIESYEDSMKNIISKQTNHQKWLQLLMTSPLPMLLLAFLVTCTTTY